MKKVEAIIRPEKINEVRIALAKRGITGMSIIDIRGTGNEKGHTEHYRGQKYDVTFLPKLKIELVIPDEQLDDCLKVITETARTGNIGDGKIFVSTIETMISIRTEALDTEAI